MNFFIPYHLMNLRCKSVIFGWQLQFSGKIFPLCFGSRPRNTGFLAVPLDKVGFLIFNIFGTLFYRQCSPWEFWLYVRLSYRTPYLCKPFFIQDSQKTVKQVPGHQEQGEPSEKSVASENVYFLDSSFNFVCGV